MISINLYLDIRISNQLIFSIKVSDSTVNLGFKIIPFLNTKLCLFEAKIMPFQMTELKFLSILNYVFSKQTFF